MLRIGPLFGVIQYASFLFQYIDTPLSTSTLRFQKTKLHHREAAPSGR